MNKKGVSIIVASVLLIALSIVLAYVVYTQSKQVIQLAPEVDCLGVDFRAEILQRGDGSFMEVVNDGNLPIKGFVIKTAQNGELNIYEEIAHDVLPGKTESILLSKKYQQGTYTVIPRVEGLDLNEQKFVSACKDLYGYDVVIA